jgi:hypothetical protein
MSAINTSLTAGFASPEPPTTFSPPTFGYGESLPMSPGDGVTFAPGPPSSPPSSSFGGLYGGSSSGSTGLGGFSGIMNGFMNMLSSALNSLGSLFGSGSTSTPVTSSPSGGSLPETMYANATASSVGDPHDTFSGATTQGQNVSQHWDDMNAHHDLLSSDSFAGGYRISTTATTPNANGVTYNASATIATDAGATAVTMNANGSYSVTENGQNVTLQQGTAVPVDATESVTLNADGSLTVADANANGGTLTTTLKSNGDGGVDVNAHATNVDLGGYLAERSTIVTGPVQRYGATPLATAPQSLASDPQSLASEGLTMPFGTFTSQYGSGESSFTDVASLLQQDVPAI